MGEDEEEAVQFNVDVLSSPEHLIRRQQTIYLFGAKITVFDIRKYFDASKESGN